MAMKRTTVFADENDLAILKAAAARRGVAEAELLRAAIHLAAMANQTWDEPFFSDTHAPEPAGRRPDVSMLLGDLWEYEASRYEQTKNPTP